MLIAGRNHEEPSWGLANTRCKITKTAFLYIFFFGGGKNGTKISCLLWFLFVWLVGFLLISTLKQTWKGPHTSNPTKPYQTGCKIR